MSIATFKLKKIILLGALLLSFSSFSQKTHAQIVIDDTVEVTVYASVATLSALGLAGVSIGAASAASVVAALSACGLICPVVGVVLVSADGTYALYLGYKNIQDFRAESPNIQNHQLVSISGSIKAESLHELQDRYSNWIDYDLGGYPSLAHAFVGESSLETFKEKLATHLEQYTDDFVNSNLANGAILSSSEANSESESMEGLQNIEDSVKDLVEGTAQLADRMSLAIEEINCMKGLASSPKALSEKSVNDRFIPRINKCKSDFKFLASDDFLNICRNKTINFIKLREGVRSLGRCVGFLYNSSLLNSDAVKSFNKFLSDIFKKTFEVRAPSCRANAADVFSDDIEILSEGVSSSIIAVKNCFDILKK